MALPGTPSPDADPDEPIDWAGGFDDERSTPRADTLGDVLLRTESISLLQLATSRAEQRRTGEPLGRVVANLGYVSPQRVAETLATLESVDYIDGPLPEPDSAASDAIDPSLARRVVATPLSVEDGNLVVAMLEPGDTDLIDELERNAGRRITPVASTERSIRESQRLRHRDADSHASVSHLLETDPAHSAHEVLAHGQRVFILVALLLLVLAFVVDWETTLVTLSSITMVLYAIIAIFRATAAVASIRADNDRQRNVTAEPEPIPDEELPPYTILVPLYDEAGVLPRLARGLAAIDYPASLLDVKLLLEEDDQPTIDAARALDLPGFVDIVLVPYSEPRTKPKSCNYGLRYARGEHVVIYDAEDVPEPDQLRRVVALFATLPEHVVCVQAHLNYFNRDQNLLTRWFTGEYSGWFDLVVPGLDRLRLPFPLGGTSNHFRTDALIDVGAWDPYNVTEDADLGIRLAASGLRSTVIASTTFEEANSETFNWIRQRSRWVKGYIQTWLVHMRHPLRFLREVGLRDFLGFNLVIAGTFLVFLFNPVQWAVLTTWALTYATDVRTLLPGVTYYLAWTSFVLGNVVFVATNVVAVMRRGYWSLVPSALLSPLYWALMSIAAWRGLLQLLWAPSYWEKTDHGLDLGHDDIAGIDEVADQLESTAS